MEQPQTRQREQAGMPKTVEQMVADAMLQRPEKIEVGGRTFEYYPPSTATLILASEAISFLPQEALNVDYIVEDSLKVARHCKPIGDVAAILILGALHLTAKETVEREVEERRFWGLIRRRRTVTEERIVDRKAELSKALLETLTPKELMELLTELLKKMQIGDFFVLTTSLLETNMTRPKKEVGKRTTVSGPSSVAR